MEFKGNVEDVKGYEGLYLISDLGVLYSTRKWRGIENRVMKYNINAYGYPRYSLTKNGVTKNITAHKIVTTSFIGERPKDKEVRHLDGDKLNFKLSNLTYGTSYENARDRDTHKTTAKGESIGSCKLSDSDVEYIRNNYNKRGDMVKLANEFNVSCSNIYQIINNKSRKKQATEL